MPASHPTLYIIDGHAQIFRAYHAISALSSPVTGEPTNATFGFVTMLLKLLGQYRPDYLVMTLDVSGDKGTFRNRLDPQYKANRPPPPQDLAPQVQRISQICNLMAIPILGVEGFEADDVIASLCRRLDDRPELLIRIVSRDKDLQQLLDQRTALFDIHNDKLIDLQSLLDEYHIQPHQVVDMLALMGDSADNIPGVKGIGPKTAAKLISRFGSIDQLLEHLDQLPPRQQQSILDARDRLDLNRRLVQLRHDVPLDFDLDDAAVQPPDPALLEPVFKQLGFSRPLRDLQELAAGPRSQSTASPHLTHPPQATPSLSAPPPAHQAGLFDHLDHRPAPSARTAHPADLADYSALTTAEQLRQLVNTLDRLPPDRPLSIDTETTGIDPMRADLCGISLAWEPGRAVYIPVRCPPSDPHLDLETVRHALLPIFQDDRRPKVGQNIKYDWLVLRRHGLPLRGLHFDTMVAAYLIDATRSSYKLDNLALAYLDYPMIGLSQLLGTGRKQITFDQVPLDRATPYAAEDADITLRLFHRLKRELKTLGLDRLMADLEMPLVEVLAEMQYHGIAVDRRELAHQHDLLDGRAAALRRQIIDTSGIDFNPDSPRQLADVLFNRLGCQVVKRRKTGPSTDSASLEKLIERQSPDHPGAVLARLVLEYRQLTKLLGTYLQALDQAVHPHTGRIHASFNQTITATGRLSSSDPNLQNIPVRTDLGRQIRKAFVAPPGHRLIAADYSQIELRILAHLSGDEHLLQAFRDDLDIHSAVAAEVFAVPLDAVTPDQRDTAKMVNFGIVYGITPFGLARRLAQVTGGEEDPQTARRIIDDYKRRYPRINQFLEHCVEQARQRGYVQTLCKRRRPIPQIHSANPNEFALGRRLAINTVVQGSAADLIKQAMVNLHRRIHRENRPMKMLLQIHDELVFEVPAEHVESESAVIVEEMTGAMDLAVPLKVDLGIGENWYDCK